MSTNFVLIGLTDLNQDKGINQTKNSQLDSKEIRVEKNHKKRRGLDESNPAWAEIGNFAESDQYEMIQNSEEQLVSQEESSELTEIQQSLPPTWRN